MVFQSYALYPHMTVYQNMAFGLENMGTPRRRSTRRVTRAAAMLQLDRCSTASRRPLSGGQRQRVAIGRAIVRDPKIFLFDEPLSNLDAELRVAMRTEITALHGELGGTMIYVTHDQVEAMTLADRIVVLRDGRIEQVGTPLELYNRPANRFVAGFIGSPRMNLLPARVDGQGAVMVEGSDQPIALPGIPAMPSGAKATLGARPEHIDLVDEAGADLVVTLDLVEQLGGETYLYGSAPGLPQVTVHQAGQAAYDRGERIGLRLRREALHLFDADGSAIRTR